MDKMTTKSRKESKETRLKKTVAQRSRRAREAAKKAVEKFPYKTDVEKEKIYNRVYKSNLRRAFKDFDLNLDFKGAQVQVAEAKGVVGTSLQEAKSRVRKGGTVIKNRETDNDFKNFLQLTVTQIRSVINSQEDGDLRYASDYALRMYTEDDLIRSTIDSWTQSIIGKDLIVEPFNDSPEAKTAARIVDACFKSMPNLEHALRHLLMGRWFGASIAEIVWEEIEFEREGTNERIIKPAEIIPVPLRKFKIDLVDIEETGQMEHRYLLWDNGHYTHSYGSAVGIDPLQEFPNRFIIHSPEASIPKYKRGLWISLAFRFLQKKAIEAYLLRGIEQWSFPSIYAILGANGGGDNFPDGNAENIRNILHQLIGGSSATFEGDVQIDTINTNLQGASELINSTLQEINRSITRVILGATMSTDLFGSSGARSTAESHERRELDRSRADAKALASTLRNQFAKAFLQVNADTFGTEMPPLPIIRFDMSNSNKEIKPEHYSYVTKNEARMRNLGLPPLEGPVGNQLASTDSPKKILVKSPDENDDMGIELREETPDSESGQLDKLDDLDTGTIDS